MCVCVWKRRGRADYSYLLQLSQKCFLEPQFYLTKCLGYFNTFTRSRLTSDLALFMSFTLPSVSIIIILACVPGRQVNNEILKLWVRVAHVEVGGEGFNRQSCKRTLPGYSHMKGKECLSQHKIRKINPLLSPQGVLFISSPFERGLNRDEGLI